MQFLVGTLLGMVGILVTIIIFLIQERSPDISVECHPLPNGDRCALECIVNNSGRKAAEDVYIGFTRTLPLGTRVLTTSPEIPVQLIEAETPPDPNLLPTAAMLLRALAVHIPKVPAKTSLTFQVRTTDPDNQRAAKQLERIHDEIVKVLQAFGERLTTTHPEDAKNWDFNALISTRIKQENLFTPGKFSYEKGRFPIAFLTDEEERAIALNQDLYARYKAEFIDIYQNLREFKAPVVRIKTAQGERTYAIFPPYIKTYIEAKVPVSQLKEKGPIVIQPPVPESYD